MLTSYTAFASALFSFADGSRDVRSGTPAGRVRAPRKATADEIALRRLRRTRAGPRAPRSLPF